jgi:hypothetical protein
MKRKANNSYAFCMRNLPRSEVEKKARTDKCQKRKDEYQSTYILAKANCLKKETCAATEETDKFFTKAENRIRFLYKTTYTDSKDNRQLVKSYINDRNFL